jgi:hypothetical protein
MTAEAQNVYSKILALRELERTTGVRSPRTQKHLLLTLSDSDLAEVAEALRPSSTVLGGAYGRA